MFDPIDFAFAILGLLLSATLVTALLAGNRLLKGVAHWPLILACGSSAVVAILLLDRVAGSSDPARFLSEPITWPRSRSSPA